MTTPRPGQPVQARAADPVAGFVGFTEALRAAGVRAHLAKDFVEALAHLDVGRREDVYWAGRATLCDGPDDIPVYDRVFDRWFTAEMTSPTGTSASRAQVSAAPLDADTDGDEQQEGDEDVIAAVASRQERLRHRDVAELDPHQRQRVHDLLAQLDARGPVRRSRRRYPTARGEIDVARTVREQLRRGGEPGPLRRHRRRMRPRRVVLLVDVSGSMEPYADSLLRLAHRVVLAAPRTSEVFTLGTRLTRVTPALHHHDPDRALAGVGSMVPDWSGGTRLGEVLRAFVDRWGQRGAVRGAVVVIASDGWERGGPQLLQEQMARLARLAHAVIWANPHRGKPGYAPVQSGIVAALPHLDAMVDGHSVAAFEQVLEAMRGA